MREQGGPHPSSRPTKKHMPWPEPALPFGRIIPWQRWEWWLVIGLFVLTLATRWPLRVSSLEEFDSANYALAVREFNLAKHQPQPPGYLFFIWAARVAHLWIPDPVHALTAVQAISGALAILLYYGLLRRCMPPAWALSSTLLVIFSAQVWLQHVRPMEDAFAFLWMLGVVYALVRSLSGEARWWVAGMLGVGLAMGAKQVLPGFLVGLWGRTLWEYVRRSRFYVIALGLLGGVLASLTWFIPLSLHVGSAHAYVAAALSQLAWLREDDALLLNWGPSRLSSQWRTTFLLIWGPTGLALPMWALVALGAYEVLRRYVSLRWLLWLVIPTLLVRFLTLGYWPRFTMYYLPFLIPLAVVGCDTLVRASARGIGRMRASSDQDAHLAVVYPSSLGFMIPGIVLLSGWAALQTHYIGSTLRVLHSEPSPVVQAVQFIRQHYEPTTTLILTDNALISRHLTYYRASAGFSSIYEPHLRESNPAVFQGISHVLKMQTEPVPPTSGYHLGTWFLRVPHWRELSQFEAFSHSSDFLHVVLYELRGPFAVFSEWYEPGLDSTRVVRWSQPEGSQIRLFRIPPQGCAIRLQGTVPVLAGWSSPPPVMVRLNGEPVYRGGPRDRIDVSLQVQPMEITAEQAVIDIQPGCAFIPAQIDKASNDRRRLGCFLLTGLTILP
jgi:Dolichyl-phosphate-mannose-protein mannosyltransferase